MGEARMLVGSQSRLPANDADASLKLHLAVSSLWWAARMADGLRLSLLVLGSRWPPETFLARMFVGLASAGVDVTVVASCPSAAPVLPGVRLIRMVSSEASLLRRLYGGVVGAGRLAVHQDGARPTETSSLPRRMVR